MDRIIAKLLFCRDSVYIIESPTQHAWAYEVYTHLTIKIKTDKAQTKEEKRGGGTTACRALYFD